jgi:hypothetical protein
LKYLDSSHAVRGCLTVAVACHWTTTGCPYLAILAPSQARTALYGARRRSFHFRAMCTRPCNGTFLGYHANQSTNAGKTLYQCVPRNTHQKQLLRDLQGRLVVRFSSGGTTSWKCEVNSWSCSRLREFDTRAFLAKL